MSTRVNPLEKQMLPCVLPSVSLCIVASVFITSVRNREPSVMVSLSSEVQYPTYVLCSFFGIKFVVCLCLGKLVFIFVIIDFAIFEFYQQPKNMLYFLGEIGTHSCSHASGLIKKKLNQTKSIMMNLSASL